MQKTATQKRTINSLLVGTAAVAIVLASSLNAFAAKPSSGATIVDTAVAINSEGAFAGSFDTLISAVVNLGLADALSGNKPYTVFAPTDAAFAELGITPDTFVGLSDEDADAYRNIVLYHVTNGKRSSQSVVGMKQLRMLNGDTAYTNGATIDGAPIVVTDVPASNGVIHAVSSVLLP